MTTQIFNFCGYQLTCTAVPDAGGKFESVLLAASLAWPSRPRTIAMPRGKHATADAAIEAAHQQGIKWVEDHG